LATGSYDAKIRLWDLRTNGVDKQQFNEADQFGKNTGFSSKSTKNPKRSQEVK